MRYNGMTGMRDAAGADGSAVDKTADNHVCLIICYIITLCGLINQMRIKKDNGGMTGIIGDAGVDGAAADKKADNRVCFIICYIITFCGVKAKCGQKKTTAA